MAAAMQATEYSSSENSSTKSSSTTSPSTETLFTTNSSIEAPLLPTNSVKLETISNKQRKNAASQQNGLGKKRGAKAVRRANIEEHPTDRLLFERLAHEMVDRLMGSNVPEKSMDLLERLSAAMEAPQPSTTIKNTTTTTTITTNTNITSIIVEDSVVGQRRNSKIQITDDRAFQSVKRKDQSASRRRPKEAWSILKYNSKASSNKSPDTFTLDDFAAMKALEALFERFGRVSHMGILDKSYTFFINRARDAALYFKVKNNIAVVGGDPFCEREALPTILEEFAEYRKKHQLGIAFLGASENFVEYAKEQKWVTMQFGVERVLNPLTNPILLEKGGKTGKRMMNQNKQLLDPKRGGLQVELYSPSVAKDPGLQERLVGVYDAWRNQRNESGVPQAYITVFDPFALPELMLYIYTKDRDGTPNGFAALRKLGANSGFHIDPCIAAPGAPRGITDLLIFAAMSLMNKAGISYLSFGFEPLDDLGEITSMPKPLVKITRTIHRQVFGVLRVAGKKGFHAKFRPDEAQQSALYLVFPDGVPGVRHMAAMVHVTNISIRQLFVSKLKKTSVTFEHQETATSDLQHPIEHHEADCDQE